MTGTVMVTGAGGYVGGVVASLLRESGHQVLGVDNLSRGEQWVLEKTDHVVLDILNSEALSKIMREHAVKVVVHLAGFAYVGESFTIPHEYEKVNVVGTQKVLEAMRAAEVSHLVFSSTGGVYGDTALETIPETAPLAPKNPYALSKVKAESLIATAALGWPLQRPLRYGVLRFFNAVGAALKFGLGEVHPPEARLLPYILAVAQGQRQSLQVYGGDFPTPDGTAIRDYTHVLDIARGCVVALEYLVNGGESVIVNLRSGVGNSVLQILAKVEAEVGGKIPFLVQPRRQGDPPCLVADIRLARKILGWAPQWPDAGQAIHDAWQWEQVREGATRC